MEEPKNWVVEINDKLKWYGRSISGSESQSEEEQRKGPSIYKIPLCITDLNNRPYIPQAVSFGPYHHGKEHLIVEDDKDRALLHFLKRCNKPLELLVQRMDQVVQQLMDSYKPLDPKWRQDKQGDKQGFLKMMILDGCFMLEILRTSDRIPDDYDKKDPVFSDHGKLYVLPYIKRDMFMLENQLPMMVLRTLIEFETDKPQEDDEWLNMQIVKFFHPNFRRGQLSEFQGMGKCVHALDVYRKSVIRSEPSRQTAKTEVKKDLVIRSATELQEAGIRFKKSPAKSLRDVSFHRGVLRLPKMVVDDTTETMFLNLIAFERLHVGASNNEVTSYVSFMDTIIDHEKDVALLHKKGILINALGNDEAVANLFNSLSKDITVDRHAVLDAVQMNVSNYCKEPWNKWRANLIRDYFRNPWACVSLFAAILLFALAIIQTGYAIADFYNAAGDNGEPAFPSPRRP